MTPSVCSHLLFSSMATLPYPTFIDSGFSSELIDFVSIITSALQSPALLTMQDWSWLQERTFIFISVRANAELCVYVCMP